MGVIATTNKIAHYNKMASQKSKSFFANFVFGESVSLLAFVSRQMDPQTGPHLR